MKRMSWITSLLFLSILFGFAAAFILLPDKSFSEQENRGLRTLPSFSWDQLVSGDFSGAVNDYFADQFPLRDTLVGWKGASEIALGKGENDGILLGAEGQLARRQFEMRCADGSTLTDADAFDPETVRAACTGINRAADALQCPFHVLLTGRNIDVAASAFDYPTEISDALLDSIRRELEPSVQRVETVSLLRERFRAGEQVYYKTDHHWTTLGAYYAYCEVMKAYGMEEQILPAKRFTRQTVSDHFYGTLWSAGGMKWVQPDTVEFWLLGNEGDFAVTADGKPLEGLYTRSWLQKKDCYSAFLDGTHDVVTVRMSTGEPRPVLLLLKDSFANSLAPFLAQHFDLVLLNLSSSRADYTDLSAAADQYGADRVLLVYTLENVITADKLSRLH